MKTEKKRCRKVENGINISNGFKKKTSFYLIARHATWKTGGLKKIIKFTSIKMYFL